MGWSVSQEGKLVLEVNSGDGFESYESAVAFAPDRMGAWAHLATSYDSRKKWVTHYVNGRAFSRERLDRVQALSLKKGLLGHFQAFPARNPNLSLKGCIDEFAIFDSAWDEGRIRQLYEVGCPREVGNL